MFLYLETYYVTPGLQDVIDARVRSLHENHATNPAFVAADWLKFLGDGTTYLAFRLWRHQGVGFDAAQGEFMAEYNRTRPADSFMQPPDIEYFDQVEQSGAAGGAQHVVCCDLPSGRAVAGTLESELRNRLLATQGFGEYRLYRFLGGENRYFRTEFWQSQAAAVSFWRQPDMRDFMARLASNAPRGAPRFRYYDVLHQLGDAGASPA